MPELPEVETVRRGLLPYIEGKIIKHVELHRPTLRFPIPADLPVRMRGKTITALRRHGKSMLWDIADEQSIVWHLGMSGSFRAYHNKTNDTRKHDHVRVDMDDGATLIFNDPRRFGALLYAPESFAGIDPFDVAYTFKNFRALFQGKKTPIKSALLDQRLITGIGNIYACEALFISHIDPRRAAGDLNESELKKLYGAIKKVLEQAIASGGSSLRDHVMVNGEAGKFQNEFMVYGRAKAPCFVCQTPVNIIKQGGRSSFFCNVCQG